MKPATARTFGMLSLAMLLCLSATLTAQAENWPCWRGPRGDGSSIDQTVPMTWNGETGKNVMWKVPLPGKGHASPIIWENRIFVVSCDQEKQERQLICLDENGKQLWSKVVLKSPLETKHNLNSYASSTPATDGKLIYVAFLEIDGKTIPAPNVGRARPVTVGVINIAAYDFDGNRKWLVKPGEFVSAHGFCSSPVIHGDLLIVNGDHDGKSYIVALDRNTGKTVWKVPRKYETRSYVTPLIREVAGKTQMFVPGSRRLQCLNPADGSEIWHVDEKGLPEQYVASPCFDGKSFFMAAGFPTYHVIAVRPDGEGDVTKSHVLWHSKEVSCYVPSPVLAGNALFVADDRGTASAFDTKTGEKIWKERMGNHYSASLIATKNHVFFVADNGITKIVKAGDEPGVVEENPLGEFTFASPAVANGRLYIRGEKHLFCIGEKSVAAASR
jgi:outer membrane protein assembly factor BamB